MSFLNQRSRSKSHHQKSTEKSPKEKQEVTTQLSFSCQMAQGSVTIRVSNFNSVAELYDQIAKGFGVSAAAIIYCTRNTTRMEDLFTGILEADDLLLVHMRGQPYEIELVKTQEMFGVTMADNGFPGAFIRRIRLGSVAEAATPALAVGQLIESIQGRSTLEFRHYEVAKMIREMPIGQRFVLRLINPLTSAFNLLQSRRRWSKQKTSTTNDLGTIRFKADGAVIVQPNPPNKRLVDEMNRLFREYLGLEDAELAQTIWDTASECKTLQEMFQKIRDTDLQMFEFPDELVFDMWDIVGDIKSS